MYDVLYSVICFEICYTFDKETGSVPTGLSRSDMDQKDKSKDRTEQSRRMKELFQSVPERKDRRVSLLLKESVYQKLQEARREAGARSLNDFAGRLLELFVNGDLILQDNLDEQEIEK